MTNPNFADEDEKPLDPVMEKVRRKMVRLLIISSSAIIIALMAVLASIVYKVNRNSTSDKTPVAALPEAAPQLVPAALQSLTIPQDFVIESSSISGNRILLFGTTKEGQQRLFVHDIGTGKPVAEVDIIAK